MKIALLIITFISGLLCNLLLPFSGLLMPVMFLLSTALLIALSIRGNIIYSLFQMAFSVIILYIISSSFVISLLFPVTAFLSATGVYIALKTKSDFKMTLLGGTAGYFLLIALMYFLFGGNFVADAVGAIESGFNGAFETVIASMPTGLGTQELAEIKNLYKLFFESLKILAPSLILSAIFLLSYFSIKLSSHFVKSSELFAKIPEFSQIHAPFILLIIAVISYSGQLSENPFISGLMSNLFMIMSVYYTLCGFSLVDFIIKRKVKSLAARFFIILGIMIVLTILSAFMFAANPILLAMFAGVMDTVFNYRRLGGFMPKNRT